MRFASLVGVVLMSWVSFSHAQQVATGNYIGAYSGERRPTGISLEIKSADNGRIQGSVTTNSRTCNGTFAVEGTYQDNKIEIQSAAQRGRTGDCAELKLELVANGNKLTGRFNGDRGVWREVQLSK